MMLFLRPGSQPKMIEIKHLGPRVTEVGDPRYPGGAGQPQPDKVHGLRRPRRDDGVHRILRKVFLKEAHRRAHPHHTGIRNEEIASDEQ